MHYTELIDKLVRELSYRVGIPNLKDKNHQSIISEILSEWDEIDAKYRIMKLLNEAPTDTEGPDKDYVHVGRGVYVRKGDEDKEDAQKFKKDDRGTLRPISSAEYDKLKADQGEEGEKAAADSDQNQQGDSGDTQQTEEPPKGTSLDGSFRDNLPDGDPAKPKTDKESDKPKSKSMVYGEAGEGDTDVKNNMFKYGFSGYQKGTGKRPAPGSAGSAFNEIASGEGIHMLGENPNLSEEELTRKMYESYKDTALGKEQSKSSGVGKTPSDIENDKLWSKCVISARSAKTKYKTTQSRVTSLQEAGKMGTVDKIHTYYGADESLTAQVLTINNANKVLLPNGTEVSKEDAVKFVKAGGGGMNPSDTATFASDTNGNLLIQFHSDKTSTADIQDNSTLAQEGTNYKKTIDKLDGISDTDRGVAKDIVDEYSNKMKSIEENYNNQTSKIAQRLVTLPASTQLDFIKNDKGTLNKNIEEALYGKDGKPKSQYRDYLPSDSNSENTSLETKYKAILQLVSDGKGKVGDVKVVAKVGLGLQSMDSSIDGIDVKRLISEERAEVVNLQRERIEKLNTTANIDVDGVSVPLGRMMEAEETIRGFHLTLMDYPPKDYVDGEPSSMVGSSLDINMGGTTVTGDVLRGCIGVSNTTEFKQKFRLKEAEELVTDKEGNVTGKTVFVYAVDNKGVEIELGKKSYRSKAGATGKTNNTFTYSTQMQKCFKSK